MGFLMTKAQTQLSSLTLDPPASHGCVCVCRKTNPHRKVLSRKKINRTALNRLSLPFYL
jgi:hypothetical protein